MKKIILILTFLIISIININAYTNISTCQTISSSGEYILNQSILNHGASDCMTISSDGVSLNCKGYTIDGTSTNSPQYSAIKINANLTLKNCIISDFHTGIHIDGPHVQMNNISIYNTSVGIFIDAFGYALNITNINMNKSLFSGMYIINGDDSKFKNIKISESLHGIYIAGKIDEYEIINFTSDKTNNYGIYAPASSGMNYGNISNSNIQAINSSLYKPYGFVGSFTYNNIKNSYLDNFSSIFVDAGEFSNNLFLDNTYLPGTILPGNCFNSGSVELCENTSVIIETSTSISKLPSINILSIILSTLIIFGILL